MGSGNFLSGLIDHLLYIFARMNVDVNIIQEDNSDDAYERKAFTVDKGQEPMRIDKWIQNHIEGATRNKVQQGIDAGFLTVNGKIVKSNYRIKPGDDIVLMTFINPDYTILKAEPVPLNIVYEDEDVLVINKQANMVVHPGVGNFSGTLLNGVFYHLLQQNPDINEDNLPRFGLVHRIDKNTTGLIVLAKNAMAAASLSKQFFHHTVQRKYVAVVWGDVEEDKGTVNAHIARHQQYRKMFAAYPDGETGKHAITHYSVLERMNYVTVVECVLETGRTHQIRVHMKHIGHTLFNDWEYGGEKILKGTIYTKYKQFVENCFELCNRCALHAKTLGFEHPRTGEPILFESEIPDDMRLIIEKWRNYVGNHQLDEE